MRVSGSGPRCSAVSPVAFRDRITAASLLALALGVRIHFWWKTPHTWEDALISIRYAENLAAGRGLVYNAGEWVLGTSTPLYAAILGLFEAIGIPALFAGKALNLAADSLVVVVIYALLRRCGWPLAAVAAACLYAFSATNAKWSVSGMEMGLFVLAVMCSFLWWQAQRTRAVVTAFIAVLLRPDGLLLLPALVLGRVGLRIPVRVLVVLGSIALLWVVGTTLLYGSPIPHSLTAKSVLYADSSHVAANLQLLGHKLLFMLPGVGPLLLFGFLWGSWVGRRQGALRCLAIWTVVYWASFAASGTLLHGWYFAPPLAGYLTLNAVGWSSLLLHVYRKLWVRWMSPRVARLALPCLVCLVIAAGGVVGLQREHTKVETTQRYEDRVRRPLGEWLSRESHPDAAVALEPIGYVGYYSRRRIVDTTGLVSPAVTEFYRAGGLAYSVDVFLQSQAEFVVLRLHHKAHQDERFLQEYRKVRVFESPLGLAGDFPGFSVWQHRDIANARTHKPGSVVGR